MYERENRLQSVVVAYSLLSTAAVVVSTNVFHC